ncbi:unnamed protein product [Leptosia nina]|uniref:Cytochrome P450 n=1 Tax=Leptosia nina TaxID=320188 RepID=A0AAV1JVC8_9NEOP
MAKKISRTEDDVPILGMSLSLLGTSEAIMKKLQDHSCTTTGLGGFSKAWLGPFLYYMVTDARKIEVILKNHLEKDKIVRFLRYVVGNASIFAPVHIWRPRRKIVMSAFTPKILSGFVDIFSIQSEKLVGKLKPFAGKGQFKIWSYINAYSLDAVMETAMGVKINAQDNPGKSPILSATNSVLYYICARIFRVWMHPDWVYRWFPQRAKLEHYTKILHKFTDEIIEKKKALITEQDKLRMDGEDISETTTFLDILIRQSGGERGYSVKELREEVLTFLVAAMDTSAVTMGYTLKLLGKYPAVQQKVFDELDVVFGDSDRLVTREDLPKLQCLERVIKEALRLFPPTPLIIREASENTVIDGITIPKGSGLIISLYGVHRNPKYWGPDPHCFDPDRFLPERSQDRHPCAYIPFSHGPRGCLGYQYALMSMKTLLSSVLRRYRVVGEPENGPIPNIRVKLEIMMKAVDGFEVALEERV